MKLISPFKYYFYLLVNRKLNSNSKRDFKVLSVAILLNLSFAFEKFMIVIGYPLSDLFWMAAYGFLGTYLGYIAFHDYFHDVRDNHDTNTESVI